MCHVHTDDKDSRLKQYLRSFRLLRELLPNAPVYVVDNTNFYSSHDCRIYLQRLGITIVHLTNHQLNWLLAVSARGKGIQELVMMYCSLDLLHGWSPFVLKLTGRTIPLNISEIYGRFSPLCCAKLIAVPSVFHQSCNTRAIIFDSKWLASNFNSLSVKINDSSKSTYIESLFYIYTYPFYLQPLLPLPLYSSTDTSGSTGAPLSYSGYRLKSCYLVVYQIIFSLLCRARLFWQSS